jgi:hypothetical protein
MTASIRQLAGCIGISGGFSILSDFLGFWGGKLPSDPTGAQVQISLVRQGRLLKGRHFNLNVIFIGSDNFTAADHDQIDYTIFKMRNIYNQVNVGVGRVAYFGVSHADAGGLDAPTTQDQLSDIGHRWAVQGDGLDIAVPVAMNVASNGGMILGLSPQPGPCTDKHAKGMNGSVVGLFGKEQTARSFSHEIGHNLGLGHENSSPSNLMAQSSVASSIRDSVVLTAAQGNTIIGHCLMKQGC